MSEFTQGHALLVGVGSDLPVTVQDAQGLADLLRDPARCAYPLAQVQALTESAATRPNVLAALDTLAQSASDQWYFRLKAPNGEIILSSEGYATKQGAVNGIESVKKNAQPENIEHRTSKAGQPYFVLKAANNQIIGASQMYKRQSSANKGAQSVINHAPTATITE